MKYIFLLIAIAFTVSLTAQEEKVKLTRKEKQAIQKVERAQKDSITKVVTRVIIENKQYVLEADRLQDRYGNSAFVQSTINFIAVDSATAVFQFGSAQTVGVNGLGGLTIEGRISSYKLNVNEKKGTYYIQMTIMATLGIFDISLAVSGNGSASATVNAMNRGQLNYQGNLVPLQTSQVFQGLSY